MRHILFFILMFFSFIIQAKEKPIPKPKRVPYFKLSYDIIQRVPFFEHPYISQGNLRYRPRVFSYINFPIAFGFYSKNQKSFHEFSISRLSYNRTPYNRTYIVHQDSTFFTNATRTNAQFITAGFRYEYNYKLNKKNNAKSNFYIGFPIEFYYSREYIFEYLGIFHYFSNSYGFSIGTTFHYQYNFAKRFHLDIAVPITIFDGIIQINEIVNPQVDIRSRHFNSYYLYKGTTFASFRVGIGVRF